jgi:hypothetical protein
MIMTKIYSLLVTSTAHVTESEAKILDDSGYRRMDYGWFFYVGVHGDAVLEEIELPSAGLTEVILQARQIGCEYVLLDMDADALINAPTYDW